VQYLEDIRIRIYAEEGCNPKHVATVAVREISNGQVAWNGNVEVFELIGHNRALRCYAWGFPMDDDGLCVGVDVFGKT
jgi:hypothetical protein